MATCAIDLAYAGTGRCFSRSICGRSPRALSVIGGRGRREFAGLHGERVVQRGPRRLDVGCRRRAALVADKVSDQVLGHTELGVGLEVGIVRHINLRHQCLQSGLLGQHVQMRRPHIVPALLAQERADRAVHRDRVAGGLDAAEIDVAVLVITHTNEEVHEIIRKGLKFSPLFTGRIKGRGPRYCPSIEDKIVTFKDKVAHQLFIEPEGLETVEYYINGFSSSLPMEVQLNALRKVKGLEKVEIFRPGYAIEYDFFQPTQLKRSLETKAIENLFFAGQINGTTGYEEAAAQGLMAGINSVLKIRDKKPFILERDESYIGVLIDDLVTKGC